MSVFPVPRWRGAPRELKGFAKVHLAAGESREVRIPVRRADLGYWDTRIDAWVVEGGTYTVEIGGVEP